MNADRFRVLISLVLTIGVALSAALILTGFVGSFVVGWEGSLIGAAGGPNRPTDFGSIFVGLEALRPVAIVQLGLVVLVATPVVRVGASAAAFGLEGDRLYVAITLGVLVILLTSLFFLR